MPEPDEVIHRPLTRTRMFWVNLVGLVGVLSTVWSGLTSDQKQVLASVAGIVWAALANWAKARERSVVDGSPVSDAIKKSDSGLVAPLPVDVAATGEHP